MVSVQYRQASLLLLLNLLLFLLLFPGGIIIIIYCQPQIFVLKKLNITQPCFSKLITLFNYISASKFSFKDY